jgi:hypothetical protein
MTADELLTRMTHKELAEWQAEFMLRKKESDLAREKAKAKSRVPRARRR